MATAGCAGPSPSPSGSCCCDGGASSSTAACAEQLACSGATEPTAGSLTGVPPSPSASPSPSPVEEPA
eukprot:scaffold53682_cov72-Phaeocystis_antarctica.AAC.2